MQTARLLKKFVEDAPEGKYQDAENPALQLWAGKKSKVWYFVKKYKFKQYRMAIGQFPGITREAAMEQCNLFMANIIKFGALVPEKNIPDTTHLTLQDVCDFYMREKKIDLNRTPRTRSLWKYLQSFAQRELKSISREEVVSLHRGIQAKVMANNVLKLLRSMVNFAIRAGLYEGTNPAANIKLNRQTPRQRYLMPSEAPKVIEYLTAMRKKGVRQRDAADAFLLMLYTWQRKSNVLSMRWAEIDETGTWSIPAEKAKARKDIVIPLPKEALEILDERKNNGSEYVFASKHNPAGYIADVKNSWKTVKKACGLENVHIHDLRHTGATYALRSGADITTVSATLAHASVSFTAQVYAHVMLESKKEASRGAIDAMMGKKKDR